ncbi:MAG: hypothetical protein AAFX90_08300 [Pseudomonadota bacterium]
MKQTILCALSVAATLGLAAETSAAPNGYRTEPINSTDFEVIPRAQQFTDGYWCAAADFARRKLGLGWQDRIYVLRGYGPSVTTGRKTAVQFTIKEPSETPVQPSFVLSNFAAGSSMSVQGANAKCDTRPFFR